MKNAFKKIVCMLLAASSVLTLSVGCDNNKDKGDDTPKYENIQPAEDKSTFKGTHIFNMTETDNFLVKDGKTDYVLVTSSALAGAEITAKDEFITLFKEATNIRIPQASAENMTHDPEAKRICLGDNDLFKSTGLELDKETLTRDGVRIITLDNTIYILGGGAYGLLYAVYDFMELTFSFDQFYLDCMTIEKDVKAKKLYNYDVTDIPDMENRATNYAWFEQQLKNRMRMPLYSGNYFLPIHKEMVEQEINGKTEWVAVKTSANQTVHNSNECLPREHYAEEHSEWYGDSGDVLCYTAHGDEEEFDLMVQEVAKKICASLITYNVDTYPNMNFATLTVEDNNDTCACETCASYDAKYGAKSAAIILFMNEVKVYVDHWLEEHKDTPYYRENFGLAFFAYNSFSVAPSHWDEAKREYVPNAPELALSDGVYVWVALMNMLEEEISIYHSKNDRGREQIDKWSALSKDGMFLWTYSTNFTEYLYFHDAFSLFNSEGYQFFAEHKIRLYYQNSQSYQAGSSTAFHTLQLYLTSKLTWNSSLDTEALVDKFMNAMFREAAPVMKEMLDSMRMHNRQFKERTQYVNSVAYASNFPYNTLKKWLDMCDQALAMIEDYKQTDPALYNSLKEHIEIEWVFPAYATLQLRSDYLLEDDLGAFKLRFKETVLRLGITRTKEIESEGALTNYANSL